VTEHPRGLTVAISREAGARGGSIARRVGRLLGWQVYGQDTLALLARDDNARRELLADTPPTAAAWADRQAAEVRVAGDDTGELVKLVFALAARGEVVIIGRGAGVLLPGESTLNVRVIAPHAERVAYMAQWLRMTTEEAMAELAARDRVRAALHSALTGKPASDPTQYDLILNSGRLGEVGSAELIVQAVKAKHLSVPAELPAFDAV
jgi:cytidylate kinase